MKKIILIVAFSLLASGQAFAVTSLPLGLASNEVQGGTLYGGKKSGDAKIPTGSPLALPDGSFLIGKTSTGVGLGIKTGTVGYAMMTQHKSGNRAFGTSYDSTAVFYMERTAAQIGIPPDAATPGASDMTAFATADGWKTM
jgi:hypothetical protein